MFSCFPLSLLIGSDVRYRSDKNYKIGGHIRSKPKILLIKVNSVIFGHKKLKKCLTTVMQLIIKFLFNMIVEYIIDIIIFRNITNNTRI